MLMTVFSNLHSAIKTCFSDKNITKKKINLIENDIIISKDLEVAETLNAFFSKTIEFSNTEYDTETLFDVNQIVDKFKNHPSILKIKEKETCKNIFSFALSTLDDEKMYKHIIIFQLKF